MKSKQNEPVIIAENLTKTYDKTTVLQELSFSLKKGEILGFLGPNGAGKTTAIRILTTILEQTAGNFYVCGTCGDNPDNIRQVIGVLPESNGFPESVTAIEFLTYHGELYGLKHKDARERGKILLQEVGLNGKENKLISTYSRGMRQRLGIARALINNPSVLFLDEPTLGLDPKGQEELMALIRKVATERHAGIIFCSHLLSEVERFCDNVIILRQGSVVAQGSVSDIIAKTKTGDLQDAFLKLTK